MPQFQDGGHDIISCRKCCHLVWWGNMKHLHTCVYTAAYASSWLILYSYLLVYFGRKNAKLYTVQIVCMFDDVVYLAAVLWLCLIYSCISIKFLCEHMSMKWVLEHQLLFIKALLFVVMDLTGEVWHADWIILILVLNVIKIRMFCVLILKIAKCHVSILIISKCLAAKESY